MILRQRKAGIFQRRARALQIYLSKPLGRLDYILGKGGVLFGALACAVVLPTLMLVVMQVALSGSLDFVRSHPGLVPGLLLQARSDPDGR